MYSVEEFDQAKTKVMKYIVYKRRTEQEIKNKFYHDIDSEMLEEIIEYLKEANYIDDQDLINRFVQEAMKLKDLSLKELQYKLVAKGFSKEKIEDYVDNHLEELQVYQTKSINKLVQKKLSSMTKEEIRGYLQKKGYPSEEIKKALIEKLEG